MTDGTQAMKDTPTYPTAPGYREKGGTSQEAAEAMTSKAGTLRAAIVLALEAHGHMTADECAGLLNESVLSVRPRFTELSQLGRIVKTGARRQNASGHNAAVWCAASKSFSIFEEIGRKVQASLCPSLARA